MTRLCWWYRWKCPACSYAHARGCSILSWSRQECWLCIWLFPWWCEWQKAPLGSPAEPTCLSALFPARPPKRNQVMYNSQPFRMKCHIDCESCLFGSWELHCSREFLSRHSPLRHTLNALQQSLHVEVSSPGWSSRLRTCVLLSLSVCMPWTQLVPWQRSSWKREKLILCSCCSCTRGSATHSQHLWY